MKWPHLIVVIMASVWLILTVRGIGKEVGNLETEVSNLEHTLNYQFAKSPAEIQKQVETHKVFYKKLRITLFDLIDELKPYAGDYDFTELRMVTGALLDQYAYWVHNAEQALKSNNIESANTSLAKA